MPDDSSAVYESSRAQRPGFVKIPAMFAIAGIVWVVLTDRILDIAVRDGPLYSSLQTAKETGFILIAAGVLGFVINGLQRRVRSGEEHLGAVLDNALDGIAVLRGRICVLANPSLARMFGYATGAEVMGLDALELVAPEERARVGENYRRRLLGEAVPEVYETLGLRRDGSTFDMELRARTFRIAGHPHVVLTLSDVSERRRAHRALVREHALLTAVVERLEDGVLILDESGEAVLHNAEARRLFGLPGNALPSDRIGLPMTFLDSTTGEPPAASASPRQRACRGERLRAETWLTEGADGARHRVEVTSYGVGDSHADPCTVIRLRDVSGTSAGIDEAVRRCRRLEALSRLDEVLVEADDPDDLAGRLLPGLAEIDPATAWLGITLLDGDRGRARLFHMRPDAGSRPACVEFPAPDPGNRAGGIEVYSLDDPGPLERPASVCRVLEDARVDHYLHLPLRTALGTLGAVNLGQPEGRELPRELVLELKQLARRIAASLGRLAAERRSRRELEFLEWQENRRAQQSAKLRRELDAVAQGLARELRPPVRAVQGFVELLSQRSTALDDDGRRSMESIREAGVRLEERLEALVHYLQLDRQAPHMRPVDPARVLEAVRRNLAERLRAADVSLAVDAPLPTVWADLGLLTEALTRLVRGVLDGATGTVRLTIRVHAENTDQRVLLHVDDDRPELADRDRKGLSGAPETGRLVEGPPDIDLAAAAKATTLMGGRIALEERAPRGRRATLSLRPAESPHAGARDG